ncbi:hypothetical protein Tco_0371697 [Tanacetum coccineum]
MSTNEQTPLSQPTSVVRNTLGKEQVPQDRARTVSDEALREYCDKNYHQILPIIAEKVHQEKVQQEKLKAVKAHINFEDTSRHSESGTPSRRKNLKERLRTRHARSMSRSPEPRRGCSRSPREKETQGIDHTTAAAETPRLATRVLDPENQNLLPRNIITKEHPSEERKHCQKVKAVQEDIGSQNQRSKSRALTCPNHGHIKTYDGSEDPEDHFKICQAAAKTERWAMPTWCHMFNSTLTGNARKKCIKDPVEIHNIKQRDGESTEEFMRRYKLECRDVKGAPECMKISRFMHGITNPELIKRLHDNIPKSVDEMMRVTTAFLRGEVAASNRERKKSFPSWKQQEARQKQKFKKGSFRNQQRTERKQDKFTLLTKTPKEILALDKGKYKPPPPMITPQNNGKDQIKTAKKGENTGKDKSLAILMIQPWQKIARQRITQTFSPEPVISFPPLKEEDGTEGPMIIVGNHRRHCEHHMNVTELFLRDPSDEEHSTSAWVKFMVVRSPSPYNEIIGRPGFTLGIVTLRSSKIIPLDCMMVLGPGMPHPVINQVAEEKIQVAIHPEYPEQTVATSSTLTEEGRKELCSLLRRNLDIFAWKPANMTEVSRHVAEHRLNIREGCLPIIQKKRGKAPERNKAIYEEVEKLVDANIIKEVHYHSWLSNPVMVKNMTAVG